MPIPLIQLRCLSKYFSSKKTPSFYALKDVNLTITKGSIFGIIGQSGAGKSTLLRCLIGLEEPTSGEFLFDGNPFPYRNANTLRLLRQKFGMIFQHFQLFSSRTVEKNITYPLEIIGVPLKEQMQRVDELLSLVGLEHKRYAYPSQLSGGEKQRVGIARA